MEEKQFREIVDILRSIDNKLTQVLERQDKIVGGMDGLKSAQGSFQESMRRLAPTLRQVG